MCLPKFLAHKRNTHIYSASLLHQEHTLSHPSHTHKNCTSPPAFHTVCHLHKPSAGLPMFISMCSCRRSHIPHTSPPVTPHKGVPRHLPRRSRIIPAKREVGALTRALQCCLPRRRPSLELEFDLRASGLTKFRFGRLVEVVVAQTADRGEIEVTARADSGMRAHGKRTPARSGSDSP